MSLGGRRHLVVAGASLAAGVLLLSVASWVSPFVHRSPVAGTDAGSHAFTSVQADGTHPGRLRPVPGDPGGGEPDRRAAGLARAGGHRDRPRVGSEWLRFALVGITDDRPGAIWDQQDGFAPVLVSWASTWEGYGLDGDIVGTGLSVAVRRAGRSYYASGEVTLDRDQFQQLTTRTDADRVLQPILDHEFGHLVGLAHVEDEGELMNHHNLGRTSWGPGDLAALAALGKLPCA